MKLDEMIKLWESVQRFCEFYKAKDGKWYMGLAQNEYEGEEKAKTYGPFKSFDEAKEYLNDNFSNPGGFYTDDSGKRPVPTKVISATKPSWRRY